MCDSVNHTRIPKRITYQTEYVGTNMVMKVNVYTTYHFVWRHNISKFLKYQNNFQTAGRNPTIDSIFMFN
jgi:hypothetical protein